ncbi:MAG: AAA family ATPase, partial [Vicinamibacterales bacterium]
MPGGERLRDESGEQAEVVAFLESPAAHEGERVTRIDTHSAFVFLAGTRAWKLKRAVRYDYLDFSTPELRRAACEREVRLNAPAAPGLYRGVVPVVRRPGGGLAVGGPGDPVDWCVEMNRFDEDGLFDRLAARHQLGLEIMPPLAAAIARFHDAAERRSDHGGAAGMTWVARGNAAGFAAFGETCLDPAACRVLTDETLAEIARHTGLLERRRTGGMVRQCHGDLHLRNIVLLHGRPTLFDAVEFNDEIACTDVLYDVAFLLMDLWRRRLYTHANAVWNAYLGETGDVAGLPLLPLFLSCRAGVRAKTSATAARVQPGPEARGELERAAAEYLAMARAFLHPPPPSLVAVGGFSGTGKSTLARALAPAIGAVPGALVLRSDEIRKRLHGAPLLEPLPADAYSSEASRQVYDALVERASVVVRAGCSTVVDAVFARPADREAIERVA